MTTIRFYLLALTLLVAALVLLPNKKEPCPDCTISSAIADSLKNENYLKGGDLRRFEDALRHLKKVMPDAAKEFEDYMNKID